MAVRVECRATNRGEESPLAFYLADRRLAVVEVLDRWPGRDHRYFKVRAEDGAVYILRCDLKTEEWDLTLFDQEWKGRLG